jgi:hypothetical protein
MPVPDDEGSARDLTKMTTGQQWGWQLFWTVDWWRKLISGPIILPYDVEPS